MMKRIFSFLLLLSLLVSLLSFPVAAEETITDLTKVYTNLSKYLYTPYYENSPYFEEYQTVMEEAKELLDSDDITQAEISKYYNELRRVYTQLMQDTYDYSSLNLILESYDALDSSIFTEESWKKLLSIRDSVKKELDSPALFSRTENMSEKQYTAYINNHINSFTTEFNTAFNKLIFVERPSQITKEYLSGFISLIRFCAREEILGNAAGWNALQTTLEDAEKTAALEKPADEKLNEIFVTLLSSYISVCNATYDLSEVKTTLTTFHMMNEKNFSPDSWERYSNLAKALEKRMNEPHFFFIPARADQVTCEKYANAYFSSLPSQINNAQENLITTESYEKLQNLCDKYKNKTSMEGLDIKLNRLKTRVSEGEAILTDKDATGQDVSTAITNIENALNDLVVAEGHLVEEQGKVIRQDEKTSRYTIIFFSVTVLLSVVLAIVLSKFFYGKVNWSK